MLYRVLRDLGNTDLPVGSRFDGDLFDARRLQLLIEQGRIAPIEETNEQVAALRHENAALRDENTRLMAELEAATQQGDEAPKGEDPPQDEAPDLKKLKVDELKAMATERGIEGAAAMKRDELLAALAVETEAPNA